MPVPFGKNIQQNVADVSRAAAEQLVAIAQKCVSDKQRFTIALSGGSTPRQTYALLAASPWLECMPWSATEIYFGDERHVRPDHPDSNYRMAYEAMLKSVPIPSENVFPISTVDADVRRCAEQYEQLLHLNFPKVQVPVFDLILLGIGPDGHTASLFPGTPAPLERERWVTWCDPVAANPNVKPAVKRITITAPVILNAKNVFVLATGAEKAPVLAGIFSEFEPRNAPVSRLLRQCDGQVVFFLDHQADPSGTLSE